MICNVFLSADIPEILEIKLLLLSFLKQNEAAPPSAFTAVTRLILCVQVLLL